MTTDMREDVQQRAYRLDKFKVPATARNEFIAKIQQIHEILRALPGFVEDHLLEQSAGLDMFNVVTIAIWQNADALVAAKEVVTARYAAAGFKPNEFLAALGIEVDLGSYRQIDTQPA